SSRLILRSPGIRRVHGLEGVWCSTGLTDGQSSRLGAGHAQVVADGLRHVGGVASDPVDKIRASALEEAQAQHIEAACRRSPAEVRDLAPRIENWHVQPGIVAAITG